MFFSPGRETHPTPHSLPPVASATVRPSKVLWCAFRKRKSKASRLSWSRIFFGKSKATPHSQVTWWHGGTPLMPQIFQHKWFRLEKKLEKYCTTTSTIHLSGHNLWYLNLEDLHVHVYYFSRFSPPTNVALPGHPNVWSSQASKAKALVQQ